ncbi:hypothetical protein SCHPADRAFT_895573 [Schizopora paradoxa]|uniref:Uncharacterized protein n=1 Tax=Schizopora paradoxa TaxID=27342 RepID=A0A0H2R9V3_9AGAM|nr:hypothetical protein SCHPADRAFT_895573 [Schizopora paradoxa]
MPTGLAAWERNRIKFKSDEDASGEFSRQTESVKAGVETMDTLAYRKSSSSAYCAPPPPDAPGIRLFAPGRKGTQGLPYMLLDNMCYSKHLEGVHPLRRLCSHVESSNIFISLASSLQPHSFWRGLRVAISSSSGKLILFKFRFQGSIGMDWTTVVILTMLSQDTTRYNYILNMESGHPPQEFFLRRRHGREWPPPQRLVDNFSDNMRNLSLETPTQGLVPEENNSKASSDCRSGNENVEKENVCKSEEATGNHISFVVYDAAAVSDEVNSNMEDGASSVTPGQTDGITEMEETGALEDTASVISVLDDVLLCTLSSKTNTTDESGPADDGESILLLREQRLLGGIANSTSKPLEESPVEGGKTQQGIKGDDTVFEQPSSQATNHSFFVDAPTRKLELQHRKRWHFTTYWYSSTFDSEIDSPPNFETLDGSEIKPGHLFIGTWAETPHFWVYEESGWQMIELYQSREFREGKRVLTLKSNGSPSWIQEETVRLHHRNLTCKK